MVIFWLTNFGILIWHTRAGALFLFPFVNEFMFMGSVNKGHNHLIVSHGSLRFWCAGVINSIWTIVSFFSVLRSSKRWCVSMCRPTEKKMNALFFLFGPFLWLVNGFEVRKTWPNGYSIKYILMFPPRLRTRNAFQVSNTRTLKWMQV